MLKKFFVTVFCFLSVSLFFFSAKGLTQSKNIICDQKYALCTSAPCTPDPMDPAKRAICQCTVHEGKNFGNQTCEQRAPKKNQDGSQRLTSNYSFAEYSINKTMTCPSGNPWTFCLDMPCTGDSMDPKRAICSCQILREKRFITLGGNCDTGTCKNAYWSGATLEDVALAERILTKEMGLASAPKNVCSE